MSKSPEAFRTISEVATEVDVPQHVLRFWEGKFTQIKPLKRGGGRRYYRPEDVDLIRGIRNLLYVNGYTIKGVQKVLREQGVRHVIETGRGAPSAARVGNGAVGTPPPEGAPERPPALPGLDEDAGSGAEAGAEQGAAVADAARDEVEEVVMSAEEAGRRERLRAALAELRRLKAMIEDALTEDALTQDALGESGALLLDSGHVERRPR